MVKRFFKKVRSAWAAVALLSVEMLLIIVLFLVSLLSFAFLIRRVIVLQNTGFDESVFRFLRSYVTETNNKIMLALTFMGTHNFLIPANLLLIAYFLFIRKHRWYSIKVPAIALTSLGLMFGLKYLFGRPRPDVPLLFEAEGLSFPSGHALFSVTFYGLLVYLVYKGIENRSLRWALIIFLVVLMILIGFSRVYLRVHYATDVIAGFCVGFMWLAFAIWLLNRMERYSRREIDPVVKTDAAA
ncbi:MAG: phosphatase PAP2 family protein [Chitinophagaceae bacterium]|nr:phosphatase PAP2 family protein [Flavisolibacter longurius]RYZ61915.1 MAG: phosphatase PAP2 family protein [Chitinophagaceae bacterium]